MDKRECPRLRIFWHTALTQSLCTDTHIESIQRILMNAPVQGSLPWFYNNILPIGEESVVSAAAMLLSSNGERREHIDRVVCSEK